MAGAWPDAMTALGIGLIVIALALACARIHLVASGDSLIADANQSSTSCSAISRS